MALPIIVKLLMLAFMWVQFCQWLLDLFIWGIKIFLFLVYLNLILIVNFIVHFMLLLWLSFSIFLQLVLHFVVFNELDVAC